MIIGGNKTYIRPPRPFILKKKAKTLGLPWRKKGINDNAVQVLNKLDILYIPASMNYLMEKIKDIMIEYMLE